MAHREAVAQSYRRVSRVVAQPKGRGGGWFVGVTHIIHIYTAVRSVYLRKETETTYFDAVHTVEGEVIFYGFNTASI